MLDRRDSPGITLIEQPERGLHPAAIAEFVELLRDSAGPSNPIWEDLEQLGLETAWLSNLLDGGVPW